MNTFKNFIDKNKADTIEKIFLGMDFPWYYSENKTLENSSYMFHSFYRDNQINSKDYYLIEPILDKLNAKSVIEVRANLTPSVFFLGNRGSAFHNDHPTKNKTAILYLNTCDGGTDIEVDNECIFVQAEENKIVIFDSDLLHRGVVSNNSDFRWIINFNYFEKDPREINDVKS